MILRNPQETRHTLQGAKAETHQPDDKISPADLFLGRNLSSAKWRDGSEHAPLPPGFVTAAPHSAALALPTALAGSARPGSLSLCLL